MGLCVFVCVCGGMNLLISHLIYTLSNALIFDIVFLEILDLVQVIDNINTTSLFLRWVLSEN